MSLHCRAGGRKGGFLPPPGVDSPSGRGWRECERLAVATSGPGGYTSLPLGSWTNALPAERQPLVAIDGPTDQSLRRQLVPR